MAGAHHEAAFAGRDPGTTATRRPAPGDFVFVPAHAVHQEANASPEFETVRAVVRPASIPSS